MERTRFGWICLLVFACFIANAQPPSTKSSFVKVDSTCALDAGMERMIKPYRDSLTVAMERVVGFAPETMVASKPESALSNLIADVVLWSVGDNGMAPYRVAEVHFAIMNIKGIRSSLNKGNITVGDIYGILPFENAIVIVGLKGHKVRELFQFMASQNGDGLSGGSFYLANGKAEQMLVGGLPIDDNKVYGVAVNDYMANGGDGYTALQDCEWRVDTSIKLRQALMGYIERQTFVGKAIVPNMQKRILYGN